MAGPKLSLLVLLLQVVSVVSFSCVLPAFMGDVPKCTTDPEDNCCAGFSCVNQECVPKLGKTDGSVTASESAFVAHQLVMAATEDSNAILAAIDQAAEKLADAEDKLKNATALAADKLKEAAAKAQDAASKGYGAASQKAKSLKGSVKDQAGEIKQEAQKKYDELKQEAKKKYDDASKKAEEKKNRLQKMYGAASEDPKGVQAVAELQSFLAVENKAKSASPAAGYDWQKYMGAPGSKSVEMKKKDEDATASGSTGADFDWQKYSSAGKDTDKEKGGAKSDVPQAPATGTGGFDWSKFVPPGMSGQPGASGSPSAGNGASTGFDWSKFVPPGMPAQPASAKTVNMKQGAGPVGTGFDWSKFVPQGMSSQPTTSKSVSMKASPMMGYGMQPAPGLYEPKTPYFDPSKFTAQEAVMMMEREKDSAKENAEAVNKLAGAAADAAEALAAKLLSAASQLREGASKLKEKCDEKDTDVSGVDEPAVSVANIGGGLRLGGMHASFGISPFTLGVIVACAVLVLVYYKRKRRSSYESI